LHKIPEPANAKKCLNTSKVSKEFVVFLFGSVCKYVLIQNQARVIASVDGKQIKEENDGRATYTNATLAYLQNTCT
jgi:hypothetical protein